MNTAYQKKWPLYLSTKNTILKKYDGRKFMKLIGDPDLKPHRNIPPRRILC
ncbi:putative isocitrate dehydrogenase (NADP(+)) [Rosa chinensis]|uniref:Putative isocitrate dehydrogenase (NADP(+)) n=1 Tax=Rosa chinensis TaxID=74649 RepID=A0A2P6RHH0_ROSCH|nr:putative isocitrate dehydrogenase (NADP(+)) [Rosa chinensis]